MPKQTIRELVLFALALAVTGTIFIVLWVRLEGDRVYQQGPTTTTPTTLTCQEDEPCWDCTTMGNHKCSDIELGA